VRVVCGGGVEQPKNPVNPGQNMEKFENQPVRTGRRANGNRPGKTGRRGAIFAGPEPGKKYPVVRIFTPCADRFRLLETMNLTARNAEFGDVILFSPACSGFDQFRNQPQRGEVFRREIKALADATGSVAAAADPNTQADGKIGRDVTDGFEKIVLDLHRGFLRQNPGAKTQPNPTSNERTPTSAYQP
jgi:hypothetical protein